MNITEEAIRIISERTGIPINQILPNSRIIEDLGGDELTLTELLINFEKEFEITIDEQEFSNVVTVKDATDQVYKTYHKQHNITIYPKPKNQLAIDIMQDFSYILGFEMTEIYPSVLIEDYVVNDDLDLIMAEFARRIEDYGVEISDSQLEQILTFQDLSNFIITNFFATNDEDYNYHKPDNDLIPYPYNFPWPLISTFPDPNFVDFQTYYLPVGSITASRKKIAKGLIYFLLKIDNERLYDGQWGELRTSTNAEAIARYNCMELVCRYFVEIGLTTSYQPLTPQQLKNLTISSSLFTEVSIPAPGDIYLWNLSLDSGHAGVVRSFNSETGFVTILAEYCYGTTNNAVQITINLYNDLLLSNLGWTGFFRPNN